MLRTLLVLLLVLALPLLLLPRLVLDLRSWASCRPKNRDIPILALSTALLCTTLLTSTECQPVNSQSAQQLPIITSDLARPGHVRNISVFSLTQIRQPDKSQPFKVISFVYLQHQNRRGLVDVLTQWAPIDPPVAQIQMCQGLTSVLINVLRHLNNRELSRRDPNFGTTYYYHCYAQ